MRANHISEKGCSRPLKSKEEEFVARLLKWQIKHLRNFPWRKSHDLYTVLVTEQLLRKTTAQQVNRIFESFFSRFGTARELAVASVGEIRDMIRPLGMEHNRARVLKQFGKAFKSKMPLPATREELLELPGIGEYAAAAALCMIYGKDVPMVDRNAVRVIKRVFSLETAKPQRREVREVYEFVARIIPRSRAREFNLALLDFSALLCKARNPKCPKCFLNNICDYGRNIVLGVSLNGSRDITIKH